MKIPPLLRPLFQRIFQQAWILNLILFLALGCLRGYGLLGPSSARMLIMLNFLVMGFLPFIFFSKAGRQTMGIKKADRPVWLLWGPLLGLGGALIIFAIGYGLYGTGLNNWYISIRNSWAIEAGMYQMPAMLLFVTYTIPALLFSPIGEEFFFRGMIHEGIQGPWGSKLALAGNALAFGSVHLLHHGITWDTGGLHILWVSGLLWVILMVGMSWVFTLCRMRSGSIWAGVLAHLAFNLGMNVTIFGFLL